MSIIDMNTDPSNNYFDIVICLGPNDIGVINASLQYTRKNIMGYRNIYIISYDERIKIDGTITISENVFPFNKGTLINIFGNNKRNGWYLQQLLKLYAGKVIPGILDKYLVLDSDTFFLKPTAFVTDDDKIIITSSTEYHKPYFLHMNRLHYSLRKVCPQSGISHHCLFVTKYVDELMGLVENYHNNKPFWEIFINMLDRNEYNGSGCSEYEIYLTYMYLYNPNKIIIRNLKWENLRRFDIHNKNNNQFVSVHWYSRI